MILRPKQKYRLIRACGIDVSLGCLIAQVPTSGYYRWRKQAHAVNADHRDYLVIKEIFAAGKNKYGLRTIKVKLLEQGVVMNHKKIVRIMKKY